MIHISIVNQAPSFADADLPRLCNALQMQVYGDFYPAWGVSARLYWVPKGAHPPADHWVVGLFDTSDAPGALGYHDITPAGLPLGKVFVKTTIADGGLVSVTTSHEILEMLADPDINLVAELDDNAGRPSIFYAYEVGDPVEADADGYEISIPASLNGGPAKVRVSDFVLPSWFESFRTTGPYDFMNHLNRPFSLNPGGYISFLDLGNLSAGWQQRTALQGTTRKTAAQEKMAARPRIGSRRSRRALPRMEWLASTYEPGVESQPADTRRRAPGRPR